MKIKMNKIMVTKKKINRVMNNMMIKTIKISLNNKMKNIKKI
jgi:hypothetical protein